LDVPNLSSCRSLCCTQKTPTPDIVLTFMGYSLMMGTFFLLASRSRALCSSFFLRWR
jgi:hypothetical protein